MTYALRAYRQLLRLIIELVEIFPPRRVDREEVDLRKGLYEPDVPIDQGVIWVHGASLGEVITLRPLMRALGARYGRNRLLATATTFDGLRQIRRDGLATHATLLPIEIPELFGPFVDRMKPALVLISETEIWPLMAAQLAARGIPCGIVNGRINPKTVRFAKLFSPLFRDSLQSLRFVFAQTPLFAARFHSLGIPSDRVEVLGSFKYDIEETPVDQASLHNRYHIPVGRTVLTFGSTHEGEESVILDALEPLWKDMNATVVIAPRHLERLRDVEALLAARHLDVTRLSEGSAPAGHLLLVDRLGELRNLFAISDLAYVGGSLIKRGGHNILEPAACSLPILSGPHLDNFVDEATALTNVKALWIVSDVETLRKTIQAFLTDPAPFREGGTRANTVLRRLAGAGRRTLTRLDQRGLLPSWPYIS
ncbi:MAG: glycosyltransferase N-terminal domain-containing protein [Candidatus Ozemobacteraceae bacterium]